MADHELPPDNAGDDLAALRRKLDAARGSRAAESGPPSAASVAGRFAGEFGAAVIVGGLVGFGIDSLAHTGPWGLIVGLGLGFVAGVVNVVRAASTYNSAHAAGPDAPSVRDDAEND